MIGTLVSILGKVAIKMVLALATEKAVTAIILLAGKKATQYTDNTFDDDIYKIVKEALEND